MATQPNGGNAEPARSGVRNLTLREQVFEHLREEILSNRLKPGAELNELALSRELEVSRGPLREALGRLASEGLVKITPRRGAVVAELSDEEFVDAYQVREALETLAIRLAVPRMTPADLARLRELHEEMVRQVESGGVKEFFEANSAFHRLLVDLSGNQKLEEIYGLLMDQMGRYLERSLALRGTIKRSVAEHEAILEAVEAGDAERAARLLADHIEIPQRLEAMSADGSSPAPLTTTEGS
jgi:DNA-binding GntR family transcriptional regulator